MSGTALALILALGSARGHPALADVLCAPSDLTCTVPEGATSDSIVLQPAIAPSQSMPQVAVQLTNDGIIESDGGAVVTIRTDSPAGTAPEQVSATITNTGKIQWAGDGPVEAGNLIEMIATGQPGRQINSGNFIPGGFGADLSVINSGIIADGPTFSAGPGAGAPSNASSAVNWLVSMQTTGANGTSGRNGAPPGNGGAITLENEAGAWIEGGAYGTGGILAVSKGGDGLAQNMPIGGSNGITITSLGRIRLDGGGDGNAGIAAVATAGDAQTRGVGSTVGIFPVKVTVGNHIEVAAGNSQASSSSSVGVVAQSYGGAQPSLGAGGGGFVSVCITGAGSITPYGTAVAGASGADGDCDEVGATSSDDIAAVATQNVGTLVGVMAQSIGGTTPDGGGNFVPTPVSRFGTTAAGTGGEVAVTNHGTIVGAGQFGSGIVAQSIGGGGGFASSPGEPVSSSGLGGIATVVNTGSITTTGKDAPGIVAQSIGGAGGFIIVSETGSSFTLGASEEGTGGAVKLTNDGRVTTAGDAAIGLVAQSIGGGGGIATGVGGAGQVGGTGGIKSLAGAVNVILGDGSAVTTGGDGAIGLLAQAIGGGGGSGVNSTGFAVATGGSGTSGGNGGAVILDTGGTISTRGDHAMGVVGQSIGGGGGNGGYGKAYGLFVSVGVGGAGGSGGRGGSVSLATTADIETAGVHSHGVMLQSIGGAGGNGGAAIGKSAGAVFSVSTAVGGTAGAGGAGDLVSVTGGGPITTADSDSMGILAQSVGGGGGNGGASTAKAIAFNTDVEIPTLSVDVAIGGKGGSGGAGGRVDVGTSANPLAGAIKTGGDGSHAILAQSIAGGGGNGGDSSANASAKAVNTSEEEDEDTPTSVALTFALGMDGVAGTGAAGGAVNVRQAGAITTAGNHAMGIVAQSIGGGGGNASPGDTDAGNKTKADSLDLSISLGAAGGSGGNGGAVSVAVLGDISTGTAPASATDASAGAGAFGVLAQSIGGGGGSASGGTVASDGGEGSSVSVNFALGGKGGNGGAGGAVTLTQGVGTAVVTAGGGAHGLVAQSVGGGGGVGGSPSKKTKKDDGEASDDDDEGSAYAVDVTLGGSGGAGGNGGAVTVLGQKDAAAILVTTAGDQAFGLIAQSIGGGGGLAGSSRLEGEKGKHSLGHSFGGKDTGATGTGGAVDVALGAGGGAGSIRTAGYGAVGVIAQSIGGGGGIGLDGSDMDSDTTATVSLGAAAGNTNISGADGGTVDVDLAGSAIATRGLHAHGLVAQSIGGGGGLFSGGNADATDFAHTYVLGATAASGRTVAGNGGDVTITNSAFEGGSGRLASISVAGDFSVGVLAQSIGGGGGVAGALATKASGGTIDLTLGSDVRFDTNLDQNTGGTVTLNLAQSMVIDGTWSMGVVAQSIGGGGGLAALSQIPQLKSDIKLGGGTGDGGAVNVTVSGNGATFRGNEGGNWGILAQSIGGGGGFAGDPIFDLSKTLTVFPASGVIGAGDGGTVTVVTAGVSILNTGAGAHGIVAQSVGGGGGFASTEVSGATGYFGTGGGSGSGGEVSVTVGSGDTISVAGADSWGIAVQSIDGDAAGGAASGDMVDVTIRGTVTAIDKASGAVFVSAASEGDVSVDGGSILADGKVAVQTDSLATDITVETVNGGQVTGKLVGQVVSGVAGRGADRNLAFRNGPGGTWTAQDSVNVDVENRGTMVLGDTAAPATTGFDNVAYAFAAGARHVVHVDALERTSGGLAFSGGSIASLDGTALRVEPVFSRLVPGDPIPLVTLSPTTAGDVEFEVVDSLIFDLALKELGASPTVGGARGESQTIALTVEGADFTPGGLDLDANPAAFAGYAQAIWDAERAVGAATADQVRLAETFALFAGLGTSDYDDALSTLTSESALLGAAFAPVIAQSFTDALVECPVFAGEDAALREASCTWATVTGANRRLTGDTSISVDTMSYQTGGQFEVAPNWHVGASLAYQTSQSEADGGSEETDGDAVIGGLSVRRGFGGLDLGGSLSAGGIWTDNTRAVSLPGTGGIAPFNGVAESSASSWFVSGRLRAAYTFVAGNVYLKPSADLDIIHIAMDGFSETGAGIYNLAVAASDDTLVAATPGLEIGGRIDLPNGFTLRPTANIGLTVLSSDGWTAKASLADTSGGDTFDLSTPIPDVIGRLGVGVDLFNRNGFEAKLRYDAEIGEDYVGQTGTVRLGFTF